MSYQVGVSSGFWQIAKDPALLGLAQKAGFIATAGVTFNQIDIETMSEFLEPKVVQNIRRTQKELGLKIGMHAEIGHFAALESAERRIWELAHYRMVETVKYAADMGIVYINFHLSSTGLLQFNEARIRPFGFQYQIVGPDGKPIWRLCEKSKPAKDYVYGIIDEGHMHSQIANSVHFRKKIDQIENEYKRERVKRVEEHLRKIRSSPEFKALPQIQQKAVEREEIERVERETADTYGIKKRDMVENKDELYDSWKNSVYEQYIMEAGEIDAYMAVAHDMHETRDPLWMNIVGDITPENAYVEKEHEFNAAVASRYLLGHLTVKDDKFNKQILNGMSVLEFVSKNNGPILTFELPEVEQGEGIGERLYRLYNPLHAQWFVRKINSPYLKLCIDFEHMLAQGLDPYKIIPQLPDDIGKLIYLFHLGEPKPYWGKAHIPIPLGSQAQEVIYEWLYMLRKKGFKSGVLIFERGGGRAGGRTTFEVFEHSVLALRKIAENLDKDIQPKDLPLSFYGMSEKNEDVYKIEQLAIRNHAWDPLEGVLSVPEEKHSFLSGAAVAKNKGQEWEKRKFR